MADVTEDNREHLRGVLRTAGIPNEIVGHFTEANLNGLWAECFRVKHELENATQEDLREIGLSPELSGAVYAAFHSTEAAASSNNASLADLAKSLEDLAKRLSRLEACLLPYAKPGDNVVQNIQQIRDTLKTMVEGVSASHTGSSSGGEERVDVRHSATAWSWLLQQWVALRSGSRWGMHKKSL